MNLIPRFYDVTGGAVLVDGLDVRDYPLEELRKRIGMVLQNNVLFTGTIRETSSGPGRRHRGGDDPGRQERPGLRLRHVLPRRLRHPDGPGGTNVSGGQKQRLCIARALLKRPKILIFDDSTSAVDTATEGKIRAALAKLPDVTKIIMPSGSPP